MIYELWFAAGGELHWGGVGGGGAGRAKKTTSQVG